MSLQQVSSTLAFGGEVRRYQHTSDTLGCEMKFHAFLPSASKSGSCPVLFYLSGLTCTDENFIQKAGAQRAAEKNNVILIAPDTSPRGVNIAGEDDSYDFGSGAGFYVNATQEPWSKNYRMYDYVTKELVKVVEDNLPVAKGRMSITGHSMGGHGALTLYLKNPGMYKSCSAFSPICNPTKCPWGEKAFTGYLGSVEAGKAHDATELVGAFTGPKTEILIDQGSEDNFLKQNQLLPENFEAAAKAAGHPVTVRMQPGYDHSYFFISTFVDDHIEFHAKHLNA